MTFPYHKHVEGQVLASKETTLEDILIISSLPLFCRSKLSFDFAQDPEALEGLLATTSRPGGRSYYFETTNKSHFSVIPANPGPARRTRLWQAGRGPGQAPESSLFIDFQSTWTPVTLSRRKPGTGVTPFYGPIKFNACG